MEELNPRQKAFCELFATSREFFGNGSQSYIEAYDIDITKKGAYASARARASALLTDVNILNYINEVIEETGFNESFIDKQLSFLATQNADFTAKLGAIKEFNKLKQRITDKIEVKESKEVDLSSFTSEQLKKAIESDKGTDKS